MKEPKYPRLADLPKDNKYDFFAEGIFPEEIAEKQKQNKNLSTRKLGRLPLSIPPETRKLPNTQKEEELVPFFAKNYPPSSESKEDICFINSPLPSDTPDNTGEAEEDEEEEEEEDDADNKKEKQNKEKKKKEKKEKINSNLNNDEIGVSVDFNSEMEYELDHPSKMMSREEVHEMIRKNQEKKREERRKKEEEERRKKEEENRKKEEERKRKEKEDKEKERIKKLEEDKKKKIKSSKKEPINVLSSIKKNYDDNSNLASNSMINDVQNIFAIPEEKGENEEDEDDTKKNFRKSSKEKYSKDSSKKKSKSKKSKKINDFNEDIEKNKNKKNTKLNSEEDAETEETDLHKKSKANRKSNGLKTTKEEKKDEIIKEDKKEEENEEEEYSNYGDQLADASPPKKQKVRKNKKKAARKRTTLRKYNVTNHISDVTLYHAFQNVRTREYECPQPIKTTFGETRQYSLRNRIRTLRHDLGEKANYVFDKNFLCNLTTVDLADGRELRHNFDNAVDKNKKRLEKKKRLRKGFTHNNDTITEEKSEYNSELLESENISEFDDNDAKILKIPKGGKKSRAKNYDTVLVIKIIEANGKNMIKVDDKIYKNLVNDNKVRVNRNQEFEILNFSENLLVVQLVFDEEQ